MYFKSVFYLTGNYWILIYAEHNYKGFANGKLKDTEEKYLSN